MTAGDAIQRFYFSKQPLRGAVVHLENSFVEALNGRNYPAAVSALLGECLAASCLMSVNLKQSARLSLQARGDGSLKLLLAEATLQYPKESDDAARQSIRCVARLAEDGEISAQTLPALLGHGHLAITIEPDGGERYQGIVALEHERLGDCLQDYFLRSEQLPTLLYLAANRERAAGLLLQQMPSAAADQSASALWQEVEMLGATLARDELLTLPAETLLHRLFHQHPLSLSTPQPLSCACRCSRQRTAEVLLQIDVSERETLFDSDGEIAMDCEFCSRRYRFGREDLAQFDSESQRH